MSLQKKCLTASAVVHGLMLMLVFVGSAFIPQKPKIDGPEFIIVDITDALVEEPNVISGGNPSAGRPQERPPAKQPDPLSLPPPVTPARPVKPEPVKPEPRKETPQPPVEPLKTPKPDPEPNPFELKNAKPLKNPPKPETTESPFKQLLSSAKKETVKITPRQTSESDNARTADAERAHQAAKLAALEGTKKALQGTGSRVGINSGDILGPGGPAQMSYDLAIAKIYESEFKKRSIPTRGNEPPVEVEVTVRRDGTVMGDRITKRSGRNQFDRAVQDVLNTVKKNKVIPFPADFKSETRTIQINFNLDDSLNNG